MKVQEAYNEWAGSYDTDGNATRDLDQMILTRVLGNKRFEHVIEIGCGTGKNTGFLARIGKHVDALDFSEGMIAQARQKCADATNVTFSLTDIAQAWPCQDGSADLVTSNLVLEHINDLAPVFSEAGRVLKAAGTFFISELHPFRQYNGTVANFRREERITQVEAFVHHITDFLKAARGSGFTLTSLEEWWHEKDAGKPPRLVTFQFAKKA